MPSYELLKTKLAGDLGGTPGELLRNLALALVALVHGTAILLLGEGVQEQIVERVREGVPSGVRRADRERAPEWSEKGARLTRLSR